MVTPCREAESGGVEIMPRAKCGSQCAGPRVTRRAGAHPSAALDVLGCSQPGQHQHFPGKWEYLHLGAQHPWRCTDRKPRGRPVSQSLPWGNNGEKPVPDRWQNRLQVGEFPEGTAKNPSILRGKITSTFPPAFLPPELSLLSTPCLQGHENETK